jgi:predicted ester cyclase
MSDENKAVVQHFYDALWNGNPDAIDDLMDANCDGDICHLLPGGVLPSAAEAFSAANSALYADSVLTRIDVMTKTHPEIAKLIMKGLLIRHEGNLRGIIKASAKKYREAIPDVRHPIEEMIAHEDMVWTRWTLRGTFHAHTSGAGAPLDGKPVTATGVSIFRIAEGSIREYRSYAIFPDHWLQAVRGIVPRP